MMQVGFLALQAPDLSPGQRYRVEAFLPFLERRGIKVRYDWLLDRDDLRVFYCNQETLRKTHITAKAMWRRLASVVKARNIDVFLVQREAFFLGGAWSEWLAHLRAPLVYDFDDAIWIKAMSDANRRFAWLKNVQKIPRIVRMAHTVMAGNDYLAAWARTHSDNVIVVPSCVDTDQFAPVSAPSGADTVTIGWSGSPSTIPHLRPLLPVLERINAAYGNRVRIRVMGDPSFSHPPLGLRGEAWSSTAEMGLLREIDIGVMPLPDDDWTRGKCAIKGLVSMAMGAATVMSPVGVNVHIVRHGENGYLPASDHEWFETLSRLIEDNVLRRRVGMAGRQTVEDHYSVRRWERTLADVLLRAGARSHPPRYSPSSG
jgi:glycosyltransferase involved in cell wall biosynthesis